MYTSPHGTQNIKNLSNLFFFSSASFIVTPFSITPPLHRLFQFEGWINHSLLWTALFMHSCDLGIGWCLPALRYFGSFIIVLNYSFLLSVKKIKCFGYTEFRPGCVTCLTNETWADVTFPCRSFKSHDIILFLLPWEQHVPLKGCFLSLDNKMKSCCTELKWTHTQYETQARLPLQTIQQKWIDTVCVCVCVCVCVLVTQSCLILCDPTDCSLPGSSVCGILQARILEWEAIALSRRSSWPRDQT